MLHRSLCRLFGTWSPISPKGGLPITPRAHQPDRRLLEIREDLQRGIAVDFEDIRKEAERWTKFVDNYYESKITKVYQPPPKPKIYERKIDAEGWAFGVGRRKTAVAQVWIKEGSGLSMTIQREGAGKPSRFLVDYFSVDQLSKALAPLRQISALGAFDMKVIVHGGGVSGQAGAVSLGLAKALQAHTPEYRPILKSAGLLTRDARKVERKKPGQKKARKKFQWVKR